MFSDEELRRELQRQARENAAAQNPAITYEQLRPAFRRARRRRRAGVGATALLFVGGSVAAARLLPPGGNDTIVSTSPEITTDAAVVTTEPSPTTSRSEDAETDTTHRVLAISDDDITPSRLESFPIDPAFSANETTTSAVDRVVVPSSTGETPSTPSEQPEPTPPTTVAPATAPPTTPTTSPTTRASTTIPSNQEIVTRCGSVFVEFTGDSVFVSSTSPAPGYVVAVHDDNHHEVEIKFSSAADEDCEVHVKADGSIEVSESGH